MFLFIFLIIVIVFILTKKDSITTLTKVLQHGIKETFENKSVDIIDDNEKREFVDFENMKCRYVHDRLGQNAQSIDVLNNYILVNNPTGENECYIKSSDTLVQNKCGKENKNLYEEKYAELIDDIYPKLVKDKYMSTTIPQNVCVVKFTDKFVSPQLVREYVEELDYKLPKLQKLRAKISDLQEQNKSLLSKKSGEEARTSNLMSKMKINQETLDVLKADIRVLDGEITTKNNTLANLENQLEAKRAKYQSVQNLNVKICHDSDYRGKCFNFPIGRYNKRQMELQGMPNDSITSLSVPQGLVAKLYSDELDKNYNPTGDMKFMMIDGRDVSYIGNEKWTDGTSLPKPNDAISSIIIEPKAI